MDGYLKNWSVFDICNIGNYICTDFENTHKHIIRLNIQWELSPHKNMAHGF